MKYGFYPGCAYNAAAGYRESVNAVCKAIGLELVELDDWNCCGATSYLSLDEYKAAALVARNAALAEKQGHDQVVVICNACYATLRKGQIMLDEKPDLRDRINKRLDEEGLSVSKPIRIRHLLEVFVEDVPAETWNEKRAGFPRIPPVGGYYGCQLTRPWADVDDAENPEILETFLTLVGLEPVDHSAKTMCCGAALAPLHKSECRPLIERIIRGMQAKGAEMAATICPLCQFNLDTNQKNLGLPPFPVLFFTQAAGLALGLPPSELGLDKLIVPVKGNV